MAESNGQQTQNTGPQHATPLHITRLVETNHKRISSLTITPGSRTLVILQGPNEAGKTSALEGLIAALGGKRKAADVPVRAGAEDCIIEATIGTKAGDTYHIVRSFKGDKAYLSVYSLDAEGNRSKMSAGQTFLDSLVSDITFNPLQFAYADRNAQVKMLCAAIGQPQLIETAKARKDAITESRRLINSKIDGIKARLNAPDMVDPAPGEALHEVTPEGIKARLEEIEKRNRERRGHEQIARDADNAVSQAKMVLADLEKRVEDQKQAIIQLEYNATMKRQALAAMPPETPTSDLAAQLQQIEAGNQRARQQQARAKALAELKTEQAKADAYTTQLQQVDAGVETAIAASDLGKAVPGIEFKEGELRHNGLPWSQASGMRKLELSTLIGMAANPQLRIMTIDEADRLDDENLKRLHALAAERHFQLWMTGVRLGDETDADTCVVKILDGKLAGSGALPPGVDVAAMPAAATAPAVVAGVNGGVPEDFDL